MTDTTVSTGTSSAPTSGDPGGSAPSGRTMERARGSDGGELMTEHGRTSVADPVVAKIAGVAAQEIDGVHAMGGTGARVIGAVKDRLGADRALSRGEVEKLALYAHGRGTVEVDDVEAIVGDASELALDKIPLATAAGSEVPSARSARPVRERATLCATIVPIRASTAPSR